MRESEGRMEGGRESEEENYGSWSLKGNTEAKMVIVESRQ